MKKVFITIAVVLLLPFSMYVYAVGPGGFSGTGATVDDTAYNATSWDSNTDAATKNAIRDKIETIAGGDVTGVGDCASGACLDGSSDGGGYVRLYDGTGNYLQLDVSGALGSDKTVNLDAIDISDYTNLAVTANELTLTGDTLGLADHDTARSALGLAIGSDVQAYDAQLADIAGIVGVEGDILYFDGSNWVALAKGTAGQVLEMNAGATAPEWDTDDTGSATALDDIGDPDAATSISMDDNEAITLSSAEDTGTVLTIDITDGDLGGETSGIDIKHAADGDNLITYLRCYDRTGLDLVFDVGANGNTDLGTLTSRTGVRPAEADGTSLGSATYEWSDLYLADGGILYFGHDQDVTITHVADTKLILNLGLEVDGTLDSDGVVALGDGGDNFSVASDGIDISTAGVITNATFDANGTGNTLKKYDYLYLVNPHLAGAGLTAGMDTTNTNEYYGQVKFANDADEATNYCEYRVIVPPDLDTSVDLTAVFHFRLGGADTADHDYVISHDTVAASADYTGTLTNAVNLDYTADGSGADGDHEQTAETTLTDWKSNLTAGNLWVIRVARDGDDGTNDASTVDSYSSVLVIKYGVTQ